MKKNFLFTLALLFALPAMSQNSNPSTSDCSLFTKTSVVGGNIMTSAKNDIVIKSGDTTLTVILVKGSSSIMMNLGATGEEIMCVSTDAPVEIEFTDGKKLALTHMGKLNCDGNAALFLGETVGTGDALSQLQQNTIKKISIRYTDMDNGKLTYYTNETVFPIDTAVEMMNIIQCLSK